MNQNIVDIDKFIQCLEKTKCDFLDGNTYRYGHTIENVVLDLMKCLVPNNSFGRDSDIVILTILNKLQTKALEK